MNHGTDVSIQAQIITLLKKARSRTRYHVVMLITHDMGVGLPKPLIGSVMYAGRIAGTKFLVAEVIHHPPEVARQSKGKRLLMINAKTVKQIRN
jgi:ABC-type dipeptide/oligopeptide/nickel transport system ATPase component